VAFTLGDDLSIKGLRFADAVIEEASASDDEEDAAARLEADFVLMAGVLEDAVASLIEWMGGEAQPTA
ncbi:recombination-associated protein RdgC, partial [Cobetia litoralis]